MAGLKVKFRGLGRNHGDTEITLYSRITCIYSSESGGGKTRFVSVVRSGIADDTIRVEVPEGYRFVIAIDESTLGFNLDNPRAIVLIDEFSMIRTSSVNNSKCLFIAVTRAMPYKSDSPLYGLYEVRWFSESNVEIMRVKYPPLLKKYVNTDIILVEGKTEYNILSYYFNNVVNAGGRDHIPIYIKKHKFESMIVFVDLGNFARVYKLIMDYCDINKNIYLYPYDCLEQLFCYSRFIKDNGRGHKVKVLDALTIESYYEERLKEETQGTSFEYIHGKSIPKVYIPSDATYLENFLNSKIGKILYDYLKEHFSG